MAFLESHLNTPNLSSMGQNSNIVLNCLASVITIQFLSPQQFICTALFFSSTLPRKLQLLQEPGTLIFFPQLRKTIVLFDSTSLSCNKKVLPGRKCGSSCVFPFSQGSQPNACHPVPEHNCLIYLSSFIVLSERMNLILVTQ